jgi:hydrogenase maturation protease
MKICVLGVGNVLMGDDALGPWVLESLDSAYRFTPEVELIDAGTPGLDLTLLLDGFDALIAVDALQVRGEPGEVRSFRRPELLGGALPVVLGPHEPTLRESLLRLELHGRCPREVLLVGAIPRTVETGAPLSADMRGALPAVERRVVDELERLGAPPVRRAFPRQPHPWWERSEPCASASPAR